VTFILESRFECWAERRFVDGIVICMAGKIDLLTVPLLESAMRDQLNGSSRGDIVEVDLAGVVLLFARGIAPWSLLPDQLRRREWCSGSGPAIRPPVV
jgi:hypothetical protein